MNIILATRNPSKAEQIRATFAGTGMNVLTLDDANIKGEAVEDQETLDGNALKKALFAYKHSVVKTWTMADDTGIFIDALNGKPGVQSARWVGDDATTDQITDHTLKMLESATDRSATFRTVVALISPEGEERFFKGEVKGQVLKERQCPPQLKMPYSAIFKPDGYDKVWAQMTVDEENAISHRGIAFSRVREFLSEQMKPRPR